MKFLLTISLLFAFCSLVPAQKKLSVKYDKFKNQTVISADGSNRIQPTKAFVGQLFFNVYAVHPGEKLTTRPDTLFLVFSSSASEWRYLRSHRLILFIDGERLDLGDGSRDGTVNSNRYKPLVTERMTYALSIPDAERIAKAGKIEMQLGSFEGKLDQSDLDLFASVVKAVKL